MNQPTYAIGKKDIKLIMNIVRKGGNLLAKSLQFHQINLNYRAACSQVDQRYILFNTLGEQHGYESQRMSEEHTHSTPPRKTA